MLIVIGIWFALAGGLAALAGLTAMRRARRLRRAGALGIGVLSGGYGREELERVGAYRVYADPADLLARADEVGVRGLAR